MTRDELDAKAKELHGLIAEYNKCRETATILEEKMKTAHFNGAAKEEEALFAKHCDIIKKGLACIEKIKALNTLFTQELASNATEKGATL